ncbi:T9SS type A sorting domain-containing protein [Dyadobacter psychrotolerans]|uniref:T9SS type A sorting domain-containing protein n=1 Tax=Dyadobacter psychrotolerans TaxID=2541721 RepID=A0A4R5DJH3_9BACT|nr:T9SS type A sorting domain-containing protein [Dyadobacter psychrotolerans]TDE12111.1 T9SS type A sorting domain-containing protein [Dyadobacter psychrotolerans]
MKQFSILLFLVMLLAGCSKIPSVEQEQIEVIIPYPNPSDNRVNLYVKNQEKVSYQIQVFNPKAKIIFEEDVPAGSVINSFSLDLSDHPKGSYQAIVKMNSVTYSQKFLKI